MANNNDVNCPVTDERARFYCRKPPVDYYITEHSGLIFVKDPPPVNAMAAYANEEYSTGLYKDYARASGLKHCTFERRIQLIHGLGISGGRLLDVGCACGFFLETALAHGFDATGVEFSSEAIALARSDIRTRIVQGDVNALALKDAKEFDVIVAFDIIEHTRDPLKFLQELRDLLRPGGWIVLSTPDTGHFLRHIMGSRWPMLQPLQHTFLFSRQAMQSVLRRSGYSNIRVGNATKTLSADYLVEQIREHNPLLHRLYRVVSPFLPVRLRRKGWQINIGEMLVFAQRPGQDR
jgi:2-polyprenyl-3-methyl-5-hydroxy-6-metoxy-1,4-benzoquinol methylase